MPLLTVYVTAYDHGYGQAPYPGPDSRAQAFGWNPTVYDQPNYAAYPAPPAAYPPGPEHGYPGAPPPIGPYAEGGYQQPPQPGAYPPQPYGAPPSGYALPPQAQAYPQGPQQPLHGQPVSPPVDAGHLPQQQRISQLPAQTQIIPQQQPTQVPVQAQPQSQPQLQPQVQPEQQPQTQVSAIQVQPQLQAQPQSQPQPQQQQVPQPPSGPPYAFDPNATYPDPNVQAWAQYYAQGGTDVTGSVYFISVPGVKEQPPPAQTSPEPAAGQTQVGIGSTAPLNLQHATTQPSGAPGAAAPGSPSSQHTQAPQSFYQANPNDPNASNASLSSTHGPPQPVPYGAPPYPVTGGHPSGGLVNAGGDQPAWPAQYGNLTNQFAGMNVNGDSQSGGHPGAQGVGAPA